MFSCVLPEHWVRVLSYSSLLKTFFVYWKVLLSFALLRSNGKFNEFSRSSPRQRIFFFQEPTFNSFSLKTKRYQLFSSTVAAIEIESIYNLQNVQSLVRCFIGFWFCMFINLKKNFPQNSSCFPGIQGNICFSSSFEDLGKIFQNFRGVPGNPGLVCTILWFYGSWPSETIYGTDTTL